jgi:cellulose synthase/poly-beta-1,6-N-acetylglucosamine synthase-like glycosyltransferase
VLLFHLFLDFSGILMAMPVIGMTSFLLIYNKSHFSSLLKSNNYEKA